MISVKGKYLLEYIIKVYCNEEKDYIEEYEKTIEKTMKHFPNIEPKSKRRSFSAIRVMEILFLVMAPEEREYYFNQINDLELQNTIRNIIKNSKMKF